MKQINSTALTEPRLLEGCSGSAPYRFDTYASAEQRHLQTSVAVDFVPEAVGEQVAHVFDEYTFNILGLEEGVLLEDIRAKKTRNTVQAMVDARRTGLLQAQWFINGGWPKRIAAGQVASQYTFECMQASSEADISDSATLDIYNFDPDLSDRAVAHIHEALQLFAQERSLEHIRSLPAVSVLPEKYIPADIAPNRTSKTSIGMYFAKTKLIVLSGYTTNPDQLTDYFNEVSSEAKGQPATKVTVLHELGHHVDMPPYGFKRKHYYSANIPSFNAYAQKQPHRDHARGSAVESRADFEAAIHFWPEHIPDEIALYIAGLGLPEGDVLVEYEQREGADIRMPRADTTPYFCLAPAPEKT